MLVLSNHGVQLNGIYFDTMLAAFPLNLIAEETTSIVSPKTYYPMQQSNMLTLLAPVKAIPLFQVPLEQLSDYAKMPKLPYWYQKSDCAARRTRPKKLYHQIDLPLMETLVQVEQHGVALDQKETTKILEEFQKNCLPLNKIFMPSQEKSSISTARKS